MRHAICLLPVLLACVQVLAVAEGAPKEKSARVEEILAGFRQLNNTVDRTEIWCELMKELVEIGPDALPQICAELDATEENRMIRRLGFALRAIGDPRAVPALIRVIPKTLVPPCSDYGLIVNDAELAKFMRQHDLSPGDAKDGGNGFSFGRPLREVFGALQKLTGQNFGAAELNFMHLCQDPRRQILQLRIFEKQARRWETWWNEHGREFTDDEAAATVQLDFDEEELPPFTDQLTTESKIVSQSGGAVLSPAIEKGAYSKHFLDLDTGYQSEWPADIPQDEAKFDPDQLAKWAEQEGVDLMCITHKSPEGKATFILKSFGLSAWEIDPKHAKDIAELVRAGTIFDLQTGGDTVMHFDEATQQDIPDANGAFIYQTRDGNWGILEITDRVTRTADLRGLADVPQGVGFHLGVRFNMSAIIP